MALALTVRAREYCRRAGAIEAHLGAFRAGGGGALDGVGKAEPAQLAGFTRWRLARLEAFEIGKLERQVHVLLELAAVVSEREPGLERHRARRNVVAPAQLSGIDAQFVGGEIDHALDHVGGLGPAVAAVGSHRIGAVSYTH